MGFGRDLKSLIGVGRNFMSVEFGRILRFMEFSGFFMCRVDISRNSRLVGSSGISRFWFRV